MEAAPKRARAGGGSAPDRLSALTDELLHRVLSFLPSRQAVQTTLLSKRWIDLWRFMPAINLNSDLWGQMENFTTNLLMRHRAPRLDAFRLSIVFLGWVDCRRDVDRWIRRAIEYSPVEIEIRLFLGGGAPFNLPKLVCCRLKRLVLTGVSLEDNFAEHLHSGCPVLEDLVLQRCQEFRGLHSDTLKNLVIQDCSSVDADRLVIRAPSLVSLYLEIYLCGSQNIVLLDTENSLVKASIHLEPCHPFQRGNTILLGSLVNVTTLELSWFDAMVILDKEFDKTPVFNNLRTLSLNQCFISKHNVDKFKALGKMLQKSPNLEKLTVQGFRYFEDTEREVQMANKTTVIKTARPVVGPIEFPMLGKLRTVMLDECDLRDNIRLLRHFLRSSPNMEKLTIQLCKLPKVFPGGKGKAKSKKTYCQFPNLVRFKCQKLKSTEIIYKNGSRIQGLVNLFLGISSYAPKNTITLTKL